MKGRGLKFWVKVPADVTYTRVNKIKEYSPGEESVSTSEDTYLDQETQYTDHSTGLIDPGETSVSVEWVDTDAGQMILEAQLGNVVDIKVEWEDGSAEIYSATITKRGWSAPDDTKMRRSYGLKRKAAAPERTPAP